jgi:hypothetical protein
MLNANLVHCESYDKYPLICDFLLSFFFLNLGQGVRFTDPLTHSLTHSLCAVDQFRIHRTQSAPKLVCAVLSLCHCPNDNSTVHSLIRPSIHLFTHASIY